MDHCNCHWKSHCSKLSNSLIAWSTRNISPNGCRLPSLNLGMLNLRRLTSLITLVALVVQSVERFKVLGHKNNCQVWLPEVRVGPVIQCKGQRFDSHS